jgi:hypothetical protein
MRSKRRVINAQHAEPDYPTLQSHLASRRRFLAVAGASVAASAVAAACNRSLGAGPGDAGTDPDAAPPQPDATIEIGGVENGPDYFTLRIPVTDELSAYLADGGYASFYVIAATYVAESYQALLDDMSGAGDALRASLEEHTYDALSTAAGITGAEADLRDALDDFCEAEHGQAATIEAVTLYISYLSPVVDIGGDMAFPSYP